MFKGLELSLNARVQDESSALQLSSASQGVGQSFGTCLCHPVPCRTSVLPRCDPQGSGAVPALLSLNCSAAG